MKNEGSRLKSWRRRAAWLLLPLLAAGCASRQFGPRAIVPAQRGYNEALSRALDQQLLLNLVRLRYRENPLFLEFSSIVAQFNRTASLGASLKLVGGGSDEGGLSAGVAASESPVLTLVPVKGRDFIQRMLAPIQPESLVALVQSGWSVERLLIERPSLSCRCSPRSSRARCRRRPPSWQSDADRARST